MIKFSIEDIATPGARIEVDDVWPVIQASDHQALKRKLVAMPYGEYLKTPYWRAVAARARVRDNCRCRMCNSAERPEVHHRTYDVRGIEHAHMDDLITLCHACHSKHHGKPQKPGYAPSPAGAVPAMTKKQLKRMRRKERRIRAAKQQAADFAKSQRTVPEDGHLKVDDLLVHASIHKTFNHQRLADWLDAVPGRWKAYKSVAHANKAFHRHQKHQRFQP